MKKKFSALQKDIEDQREEIRTMFAHKKELYQVSLLGSSKVADLCFGLHGVLCTAGLCLLLHKSCFASVTDGVCIYSDGHITDQPQSLMSDKMADNDLAQNLP